MVMVLGIRANPLFLSFFPYRSFQHYMIHVRFKLPIHPAGLEWEILVLLNIEKDARANLQIRL